MAGGGRCKMLYTTTLTCTSGDLSMVYHTSQDTTAGWRHCYTPRARRNSTEHRLLPEPVSLISAPPKNYRKTTLTES